MFIKKIILLSGLVTALVSCTAQEAIPLYKGHPPGWLKAGAGEEFLHPEKGRPSVINVVNPSITVFKPEIQDAAQAAVVICPGGGYTKLTIEDGGYEAARQLAAAGITAFVLKYRTWQEGVFTNFRELPFRDLQQALHLIQEKAAQWNIDTAKIGLMGFSAGGHLVTMTAVTTKGIKPAFTILAYPVISFTDSLVSRTLRSRKTLLGDKISNKEKESYSPELHVTATTPPAFLVHAEDDSTSLAANSVVYYRALIAHKVPGQLLIYQKGGHGFALHNKVQDEYWLPQAIKWLGVNGFYEGSIK